jgi:hypothetical protein
MSHCPDKGSVGKLLSTPPSTNVLYCTGWNNIGIQEEAINDWDRFPDEK